MKKTGRRSLTLLLSLFLILILLAGLSAAAMAADSGEPLVAISGEQLEQGTYYLYDPDATPCLLPGTKSDHNFYLDGDTLYLNRAPYIECRAMEGSGRVVGIICKGDLKLHLTGESNIIPTPPEQEIRAFVALSDEFYGLYVMGDLSVSGKGTLIADLSGLSYEGPLALATSSAISCGASVRGDLTVDGGAVLIGQGGDTPDSCGIAADGDITVKGGSLISGQGGDVESFYVPGDYEPFMSIGRSCGVVSIDGDIMASGKDSCIFGEGGDLNMDYLPDSLGDEFSAFANGTFSMVPANYGVVANAGSVTAEKKGWIDGMGGFSMFSVGVGAAVNVTASGADSLISGYSWKPSNVRALPRVPDLSLGVMAYYTLTADGGAVEGHSDAAAVSSTGVGATDIIVSDRGSVSGTGGQAEDYWEEDIWPSSGVWAGRDISVENESTLTGYSSCEEIMPVGVVVSPNVITNRLLGGDYHVPTALPADYGAMTGPTTDINAVLEVTGGSQVTGAISEDAITGFGVLVENYYGYALIIVDGGELMGLTPVVDHGDGPQSVEPFLYARPTYGIECWGYYSFGILIERDSLLIAEGGRALSPEPGINLMEDDPLEYKWRIDPNAALTKGSDAEYLWSPYQTYVEIDTRGDKHQTSNRKHQLPGDEQQQPGQEQRKLPFNDVRERDWFYENVLHAYEDGLIDGRSANTFAPYDKLTIAEAVKLAACMNQLYTTGSVELKNGSPIWYSTYVAYAIEKGIITEGQFPDYDAIATRADFAVIFAKALPEAAYAAINTVPDGAIPDVAITDSYGPAVYKLYRAGIMQGNNALGTFAPHSDMQRCQAAAFLDRMMDPSHRVTVKL